MHNLREQLLLLYSTPLYVIAIGLELLLTHLYPERKVYTVRDTLVNVYFNIVNTGVDILCRLFYLGFLQWVFLQGALYSWSHFGFAYWILLLILVDFTFYWMHRFDHEIRFFWAVHVTHHSSEEFNFTTGFRSSVFEPLYRFVYFIPLVWLGFRPLDILFIYSATQIWGTFVHTKLIGKMGWLEWLFVTPSHHRVHHASNALYLDKNMGMFLIVWDKLFGTFQKELSESEYEPIRFGLTKNLEKQNALTVLFHEWIQIWKDVSARGLSRAQRIHYLFAAPGYSHDGSRKTTKEIQQGMENETYPKETTASAAFSPSMAADTMPPA